MNLENYRPGLNEDLLKKRYYQKDETSWNDVCRRVAFHATSDMELYNSFFSLIHDRKFLPSRMPYMGTKYPFASSCFDFPIEDSLSGIMSTLSEVCQVQKYGGGCIGGESLILTDHGPIPIKELVEKEDRSIKVLSYDPDTHGMEYKAVEGWHTNPLPGSRIYEVEFSDMRGGVSSRLRASDWHPFFVFDGKSVVEVRADDLKPGMSVIGSSDFSDEYDSWAWVLGYITGDGAVGNDEQAQQYPRVRIVDENPKAIERAASILAGSNKLSKDIRYHVDVWECNVFGTEARRVGLEFDEGVNAYTKHIPKSIWSMNAGSRLSYLVGYLDADGWYDKNKKRFEAYTISSRLATEIVALAGSMGIRSSIRQRKSRRINEKNGFNIRFHSSPNFTEAVCELSAKYVDIIVGWVCGVIDLDHEWKTRLQRVGVDTYTRQAWRSYTQVGSDEISLAYWLQHGKASRETAASILSICGENVLANAVRSSQIVKSSKQTGVDEVLYDLTVPGTQNYVASDPTTGAYVVVHNTGINFSNLRPKGNLISTSGGEASGPVSFMGLFHNAMEVVHRAGKKHAAQMGILNCDHPDIFEFIHCKDKEGAYWTFNISVAISDAFMDKVEKDGDWQLKFGGEIYNEVKARHLWEEIVTHAWGNGDPGVIFMDTVNRNNRYPEPIEACNPCGEQMLPPHVSCNLGSIDLSRFVVNGQIDVKSLLFTVKSAILFLDGSVQNAYFPIQKIQDKTRSYRNIGLGVMGWADMLIMLGIPYDSERAVGLAERIMDLIDDTANSTSIEIGGGTRVNTTVTSIAPTGSISMLAGCSSGIEPLFGITTMKNTYVGSYFNTHWLFEAMAKEGGFYNEEILAEIAKTGSLQHLYAIPANVKRLFKTTMEIDYTWHIKHQAAFQKYTDNAVSKTINLPNSATVEDVANAYKMAYETGCKSVTVYRDGSRQVQVMDNKETTREVCPKCKAILFMDTGEKKCVSCGYVPDATLTEEKPIAHKAKRPNTLQGSTYKKETPIGTAYVTVNSEADQPFEVFLNVGKAGSEVAAVSEALGRLMSLILRLPAHSTPLERLKEIVGEMIGIGGGRHIGFGPKRVKSLPDGIAQVLTEHLNGQIEEEVVQTPSLLITGEICPDCGEATLLYLEGCNKCSSCGYSEC